MVAITLKVNLHELTALPHPCTLKTNWTNWKLFKILMWKHIKQVKNLLFCAILKLLRQEIISNEKILKGATNMLITWANVSTKLFWFLTQENFLNRNALSRLHCNSVQLLGKQQVFALTSHVFWLVKSKQ